MRGNKGQTLSRKKPIGYFEKKRVSIRAKTNKSPPCTTPYSFVLWCYLASSWTYFSRTFWLLNCLFCWPLPPIKCGRLMCHCEYLIWTKVNNEEKVKVFPPIIRARSCALWLSRKWRCRRLRRAAAYTAQPTGHEAVQCRGEQLYLDWLHGHSCSF